MSKQYPGGLITKTPVVPSGPYQNSTASGIWTLDQQAYWAKLGQWPTAGNSDADPQFNYVTMLLHGDGTNGAQNNTFLDSSTNNFTITRNGNTTQGSFSPYGSNWSNQFNGSSSITAPDSSAFDYGSGDFTLECWIFPTTTNSSTLLTAQTSGGNFGPCNLFFNSGALELYSSSNNSSFDVASGASVGTPAVNQWSHVAVSRSGTSIRCFLNGTLTSTTTSSATLMNATGTFQIASRNGGEFYSGYVSNFRVVKGTAVYTAAFTPPTAPLTAISGTSLLTCADNRFLDDSTNNFTLTAVGTPSVQRFNPFGASTAYSTSVIGGSGYFDGNGDYLTVPNNAAFKFGTGDYTIEFWLFYNAYGTFTTSIRTDGASPQWVLQSDSGVMDYYVNGSVILAESSAPSLSSWNHYAVVRNGSGTNNTKMYRNGVQVAQATNNTDIQPTSQVVIGSGGDSNIASFGLNGYLSNIRVVKGTAVYTSAFTPPTAPLTAISGTSLLTNFTNGAIFDNAMMNDLETVGNAQISTSVKKYGTGSLKFDGTGDYLVSNPANTNLYAFGTGDFTIEFWLYLNSTASFQVFYDSRTAAGEGLYPTIYTSSGTLAYYTNSANRITGSSLSTNTWYHIAVSRSGSSTKMFVNGTQDGSTYTDSNNYINGALRPMIGADGFNSGTPGGNPMNGYIDDLRITNGYARYTATFTPPTAAFFNYGPN